MAIAFAREGADVLISYLDEEEDARETARWVEEAGRRAVLVPGDICDEAHCERIVRRAVDELGGVDVLVNNAAMQRTHEELQEFSSEEFDRSILRARCRLRLSPSAQRRLGNVTGPAAAERALAAAGDADADGWRTTELEIESDEVACSQLIALGAGVEVLAPDSLRLRLHELGAAIARHHRPTANPPGAPS